MNPTPAPTVGTVVPFTRTLTPLIGEYLRGRVARGEITRLTAADLSYCLAAFDRSFGARSLAKLGRAAIDRWLETIGHRAPATRREYLSRVRGFCRWLVSTKRIARDPTDHVPTIHQPRHVPVTLTVAEVGRLLAACPDDRARAIVWLMVGCGCRCVEVARLTTSDYDPDAKTIVLVGKALHQRIIPVPDQVAAAVDRYLDTVGRVAGPLIRNAEDGRSPLSPRTVSGYMRRWMLEAAVKVCPRDGRSAHGLRRTAGSDVMERSGDIRVVQEMLGHARIETTARSYLRPVPLDKLREAMEGRAYGMFGPAA